MFIVTAKSPRRLLKLSGLLAVLALCAAAALPTVSGLLSGVQSASLTSLSNPKGVRTNEDRIAYLSSYGWEVSPEPIATQELLIPSEMDESYQEYLTLQRQQGFDLEQYAGKRVKRYTYEVYNYPSGDRGVQANLLICRSTVIGGEVLKSLQDHQN